MKLVEADLELAVRYILSCDPDVCTPHVHRNALDCGAFLTSKALEVTDEALAVVVVGNMQHMSGHRVGDDRDVLVAALKRCLVDRNVLRRDVFATQQSARDCALHDAIGSLPSNACDLRDISSGSGFEPVDDVRFEHRAEAGS